MDFDSEYLNPPPRLLTWHATKADRLHENRCGDVGYALGTALLVDAADGCT